MKRRDWWLRRHHGQKNPARWFLIAMALVAFACGGPTTPSLPAIAQVAGIWNATARITAVSGGECLGSLLQSAIGTTDQFSAAITQNGSSLNATVTSKSSGSSCGYTGTAGSNSIVLNVSSCQSSDLFGVRCANGALRDMRLQAGAINATVSGSSGSGTAANTYNVFVAGTSSGVGILTINESVSMTR